MSELEACRAFYAELITANAGISERGSRLATAFAGTARERFLGRGPWKVFTPVGYLDTPNDDPTLLYQDITVALRPERRINNGQPTLHARAISALGISFGETVIHIGAGTGYYTAVLADLAGPTGAVTAFEIEEDLAASAAENLLDRQNVQVIANSGSSASLAACDVIYVNAGATDPLDAWLDALKPDGRLLFPLTPTQGLGGMLLVTRRGSNCFSAQFVAPAMFIPCVGARDEETGRNLSVAFARRDSHHVKSLRRGTTPDETCWIEGRNWWLSKTPIP